MTWLRRSLWVLLAAAPVAAAGCSPLGAGILTPVPIQPWVAERMDDKYMHRNDHRTPVMPPINRKATNSCFRLVTAAPPRQ